MTELILQLRNLMLGGKGAVRMIGQNRIEEIEQKARQVIGDNLGDPSTASLPIDIATILSKQNLQLYSVSYNNPSVSGSFKRSNNSIYVSADDSSTRQLFTIAHELGHYFLEPNKATDIFYRHQMNEFKSEDGDSEQEANWFAASLLMPAELVEKKWKENKNINLISAIFGVSTSAARWRLKNLGLID